MSSQIELATFGAGCFWSVEARFRAVEGVVEATSGYMGGQPEPDYHAVCTGTTGHAEVVQVQFDAQQVSYEFRQRWRTSGISDPASCST